MNLQSLRSLIFEVSKKKKHTPSDAVAMGLLCMAVVGVLTMELGSVQTAGIGQKGGK